MRCRFGRQCLPNWTILPDENAITEELRHTRKLIEDRLKSQAKNALTPEGKYISIDDGIAATSYEDLVLLKDLVESGEFKHVIDRSYPLEQMVEAHRYVETGHKKGNVVLTVEHNKT